MAFVHRHWLKKGKTRSKSATFTPRKVWFDRGAPTLPTDSCPTNPVHPFPSYWCASAFPQCASTSSAPATSWDACVPSISRFVIALNFPSARSSYRHETIRQCSQVLHVASCLPLFLLFFSLLLSWSIHRAKCQLVYLCQWSHSVFARVSNNTTISDDGLVSFCFHPKKNSHEVFFPSASTQEPCRPSASFHSGAHPRDDVGSLRTHVIR